MNNKKKSLFKPFTKEEPKSSVQIVKDVITKRDFSTTTTKIDKKKISGTITKVIAITAIAVAGTDIVDKNLNSRIEKEHKKTKQNIQDFKKI